MAGKDTPLFYPRINLDRNKVQGCVLLDGELFITEYTVEEATQLALKILTTITEINYNRVPLNAGDDPDEKGITKCDATSVTN